MHIIWSNQSVVLMEILNEAKGYTKIPTSPSTLIVLEGIKFLDLDTTVSNGLMILKFALVEIPGG